MIELKLEEALAERGKTFYWLAKESGISHPVMSKLRHHQMKALRLDVLDRLCETLQCQPGDLLTWRSNEPKAKKEKKAGKTANKGSK